MELNPDPRSTWGASESYKAAWREEFGPKAPAKSASKDEWVEYAVENKGADPEEVEGMTRTDLVETYGSEGGEPQ